MERSPFVGQVDRLVAADQSIGLEAGEERAGRVGVEGRAPLERVAQRRPSDARSAVRDQLECVPRLGFGLALCEVSAQDGAQGPLGEREGWPNWP